MVDINNLNLPNGYYWLLENDLIGFDTFSRLQPWHYLGKEKIFWIHEKWQNNLPYKLLAFAKRQDNDEIACFIFDDESGSVKVAIIQGWTSNGFALLITFEDFWSWLKHVIDDIKSWVSLDCPVQTSN